MAYVFEDVPPITGPIFYIPDLGLPRREGQYPTVLTDRANQYQPLVVLPEEVRLEPTTSENNDVTILF